MLRNLVDVLAVNVGGERLDERVLGADPIAVLLERLSNVDAIAGLDRNDDALRLRAAGHRLFEAAIDLRSMAPLRERGR